MCSVHIQINPQLFLVAFAALKVAYTTVMFNAINKRTLWLQRSVACCSIKVSPICHSLCTIPTVSSSESQIFALQYVKFAPQEYHTGYYLFLPYPCVKQDRATLFLTARYILYIVITCCRACYCRFSAPTFVVSRETSSACYVQSVLHLTVLQFKMWSILFGHDKQSRTAMSSGMTMNPKKCLTMDNVHCALQ